MPEPTAADAVIPVEHGRHYNLIKRAIPPYLIDAPAEQRTALRHIAPQVPDWYRQASAADKYWLNQYQAASFRSKKALDKTLGQVQPLNAFAQPILEAALATAGFTLAVDKVFVRLYTPVVDAFGRGTGGFSVKTMSLLQAALHNFEVPETEAGYFAEESGFIAEPDQFGRFKPYATDLTLEAFTRLCRALDIGAKYQAHLQACLRPGDAASEQRLRDHYISFKKDALKVDAWVAMLKGDIGASDYDLVMRVIDGEQQIMSGNAQLWYRLPGVFDIGLKECLVIDFSVKYRYSDSIIVWLPGDPEHPLKYYASFDDFRDELVRKLTPKTPTQREDRLTPYQQFLTRFIEQKDRPYFYRRLTETVMDAPEVFNTGDWFNVEKVKFLSQVAVPLTSLVGLRPLQSPSTRRVQAEHPTINVHLDSFRGRGPWAEVEVWGELYESMRDRMFADGRSGAIPTADADADNRSKRLSHYLNIGLLGLNLVAMVVPPLGDVMLVALAGQLLYEVIEGYVEWSKGDLEAAWGHISDVLENLAMLAAGAAIVHVAVSPVIEKLSAVTLPGGKQRLWQPDLAPYEHSISLETHSKPNEVGLHSHNQQQVLPHEGKHYVLKQDSISEHYRAQHPTRTDAYQPEFKHNGHGVWVHEGELPATWERATLLRRLGAPVEGGSDGELEQALKVSGVREDDLRRMYAENEPTPALLLDSIRQFKAYARAKDVVAGVKAGRLPSDVCTYPATFTVELAGWPAAKAIEVVDPLKPQAAPTRYGSAQATGADVINISRTSLMNGELPGRVVDALSQQQLEALLGERVPFQRDERLSLFKEQLSARMEQHTQRLFDSLYQDTVLASDPLRAPIELLKRVFPKLPTPIARRLIADASTVELGVLKGGKVPARIMRAARTLQREARLSSAYLGLYIEALVTPDTEALALSTLETLPGWKNDLRLEVRNDHFTGELRASVGPDAAAGRKVLVRVADGQYVALDEHGEQLHGVDDLYRSLQRALPDVQRASMQLPHASQGTELQLKIQQHALSRDQLRGLLNIRGERRPFFMPPERLPDGRLGYPLSGRGAFSPQDMLRTRFERLYPAAGSESFTDFFRRYGPNASARLQALEVDLDQLDRTLNQWLSSPVDGVPVMGYPTDAQIPTLRARHHIRDRLKQAWRRAGPAHVVHGEYIGESLSFVGEGLGPVLESLPPLTSDLSHVTRINLMQAGVTDAIDGFLSRFPKLRWLDLRSNQLTRLPASIEHMPRLHTLDLGGNNIRLTPESATWLRDLTRLQLLSLDHSPLGLPPDLSRMPALKAVLLRECGLDRWPTGLFAHSRPANFEMKLTKNPLSHIPEVAPGSDRARMLARTAITREMATDEVNQKIDLYRESVGIDAERQNPRGLESSSQHWISGLSTEEATTRQAMWNRVEEATGSEPFFNIISQQAKFMNKRAQASIFKADMQAKLWRMLRAMDENPDLRDTLFEMASAPFTCVDAGAQLFNAMGVEVLWYEAYQAPQPWLVQLEVLELAKGKARLDELGHIARARVAELEATGRKHLEYDEGGHLVSHYDASGNLLLDIDEVEIYLAYATKLADRLNLPWQSPDMLYAAPDVTPQILDSAYTRVLALEDGEGLRDQLLEQPKWLEFIEGAYGSDFTGLRAKFQALDELQDTQGKLSDTDYDAALLSLDAEHKQLLKTVTDKALGKPS